MGLHNNSNNNSVSNIDNNNNNNNNNIITTSNRTNTNNNNNNNNHTGQNSPISNPNGNLIPKTSSIETYSQFLQSLTQQQLHKHTNQSSSALYDVKNIDLLLQQYSNDFNKLNNNSVPNSINPICINCLQNNWKCKWIPDLGKCAQCEGIQWKCELINTPTNTTTTTTNNNNNNILYNPNVLKRDYSIQDKNVKRHKGNNLSNNTNNLHSSSSSSSIPNNNMVYSNFISNLYNSISPNFLNTNINNNNNNNNNNNTNTAQQTFPNLNINTSVTHIQYPRSSFYVGPTSVYDINIVNSITSHNTTTTNNNTNINNIRGNNPQLMTMAMDQIQISNSSSIRKVSPTTQFLLRDEYDQSMYVRHEQEIDMVERLVYPHGKVLIDIFFKLIHPYFPILHERVFLEKYSRSYRELTAPLLASIYSLALQWWDFHPKLIGFNKPPITVINKLNDLAFNTFFNRIDQPKLSMIQAGLLILQCRANQPNNNWVICSNLVALAEELGLGVDCQDWKLPKWEKDLRKRLAWAVWSQDKWTALIEGRHSHLILGRNWLVKLLRSEDFPQSSHVIVDIQRNNSNHAPGPHSNRFPGNDFEHSTGGNNNTSNTTNNNMMMNNMEFLGKGDIDSTNPAFSSYMKSDSLALIDINITKEDFNNGNIMFQHMVSLSIIIGEIMDTFYTQGAIHINTSIEQVLKLAKPLQLKLREWYHSLPPQLSMTNFVPRKFNSNATLTLSYFAAEITLHRKIISTLFQNSRDAPKELTQVCRTAAKTRLIAAIEFVRDLKNEHINSFWYSSSTGNFMLIGTFAALLYVTSQSKEEVALFRDLMRNYIWILRVGSKSFDKLKIVLDNMHQLLVQVPGLLTDEIPIINEFVPPPLSAPGTGFNPGIMANGIQQQMFNQYPNMQNPPQQYSSSSPVVASVMEQRSPSSFVLQNNASSNNNTNNTTSNNGSVNTSNLMNSVKKVGEQISPEDILHSVMAQSPSNKANATSTPGSSSKTPIFSMPSSISEVSINNDNNNTKNTLTPIDPKSQLQQQETQYSPSLQSQISETYSVGQLANSSETPKTDPSANIMDTVSMKDNLNTSNVSNVTTTVNNTNNNPGTSIKNSNTNGK